MNESREIVEFSKEIGVNSFYHALNIYLKKPQVINRKLSCLTNVALLKLNKNSRELSDTLLQNVLKSENEPLEALEAALKSNEITHEKLDGSLSSPDGNGQFVSLDRVISKNNVACFQIAWLDRLNGRVSFYSTRNAIKVLPPIDYAIQFRDNRLVLLVGRGDFESDACNWLRYVLLKKLQNWMENYEEIGDDSEERIESHSLINREEYSQLYASLKEKYGETIESIWTEEATDPKKFIYEDIAICAYLMVFWKAQREENGSDRMQTFLDFGCGNGLLVYLLTQEGHPGYGIDLRQRNIWSKYNPQVDLRENTWTPNDNFSEVDWIIGNHSDELSCWVPVVAYRSSFTCNYFLLPCCAYQFSGAKFQRRGTSKSPYMSYIDFLREISSVCGFKSTLTDRLKIPSTKRICLIGLSRSHGVEKFHEQCAAIDHFIKRSNEQNQNFVPREKVQEVRNCTKTDRKLTEKIVKTIFEALMTNERYCQEYGNWNCGDELLVSDAVKLISSEDLKKLKSECGGLQTLLKNKHQIFDIRGGTIKIRKPKRITDTKISEKAQKRNVIKSSPCYFNLHHKQGCFLKSEECCYRH